MVEVVVVAAVVEAAVKSKLDCSTDRPRTGPRGLDLEHRFRRYQVIAVAIFPSTTLCLAIDHVQQKVSLVHGNLVRHFVKQFKSIRHRHLDKNRQLTLPRMQSQLLVIIA